MEEIGSGLNYRLTVDKLKNRMYLWCFGELMSAAANEPMVSHVRDACTVLNPGFTVLADFLEVKLLGLPDITQRVQTALLNGGVGKVATVWNKESFSKLVVDSSADKIGDAYAAKRKAFANRAEAESWLEGQG